MIIHRVSGHTSSQDHHLDISRLSPQMQSANSLYKWNQQHDQNYRHNVGALCFENQTCVQIRLVCTLEQKALAKMRALKFASWTFQVSHGNATQCQDTKSIWGVNAKAFGCAISTIQRGARGFPCFPQSLFGFFGKNGHMAPSIAPCALFASDAFRIALRMIFIAISYLKFATIQNSFATCISAMKALLMGKEYNTCNICDLF